MSARTAAGVALAVALASCTWERTNRLGPIDPWPPAAVAEPRSLALRIYGTARFEDTPADLDPRELVIWNDVAMRAYGESKLFSSVASTWQPTDIVAEISINKNTGKVKLIPLLIGGLVYRETDIVMRTRFRRSDGTLLRLVNLSEAIRTIAFLTTPLRESEDSLREILYDLNRATLDQAARGGVPRLEGAPAADTEEAS